MVWLTQINHWHVKLSAISSYDCVGDALCSFFASNNHLRFRGWGGYCVNCPIKRLFGIVQRRLGQQQNQCFATPTKVQTVQDFFEKSKEVNQLFRWILIIPRISPHNAAKIKQLALQNCFWLVLSTWSDLCWADPFLHRILRLTAPPN